VSATLFVWVHAGRRPPEGFVFTGVVSVWPDTGKVRAELWEGAE
jgi:hypothetical protein